MAMSKQELIALRGYSKSSITKLNTYLTDHDSTSVCKQTWIAKRDRLKEVYSEYIRLSAKIQIIDETKDDEDPGEMEDVYIELLTKLNKIIDRDSSSSSSSFNRSASTNANLKLPNIVIPKFSGQYTEYYQFMNMFDSVIGSDNLPPVQKFYYLKSFLSDEPLTLVDNLPLNDASYEEARKLLKDRYDNKFQTTCEHINALLDMHAITRSTPANLRVFISGCKQQLAALKNLGEPVDQWDSILVCLLSKKLDLISSRAYQLERDPTKKPTVHDFLSYLERRALAMENTDTITNKPHQSTTTPRYASNAAIVASDGKTASCIYCKSNHKLYTCPAFKLAPSEKKLLFVAQNKICKLCLNVHEKKCRFHFKCNVCKKAHHTLLHTEPDVAVGQTPTVTLMSSASHEQVLLPTARVKLFSKSGTIITCRALLDSGSQVSFMTEKLADLLGGSPDIVQRKIVGITNAQHTIAHSMDIEIHSLVYPFKTNVKCHVVPQITSKLPQAQIDISHLNIPSHYKLADDSFDKPGDVHLLLGAEIFFQILLPQTDPKCDDAASCDSKQLRLINTSLGYIIAGRTPSAEETNQVISLFCRECDNNISETMSKFWTTEQVAEIYPENLPELKHTEKHFQETVVLENDIFQVSMPLKVPLEELNNELGDSFHLALGRFINLEKRFKKDQKLFQEYKKSINQYIDLGHGKYVDINQYDLSKDPVYFLAHHPVIREQSLTTKVRPVFDGSMKTNKKVSLNDMLMKGPVVQKDLLDILIAFRLDKYFFISDIKMMFRKILVDPKQRSLQNILWRDQPNEDIKCIQLQTVTFGLKSSSYLATRCLIELAQRFDNELPSAASILNNNTYVDDVLVTNGSESGLVNDQKELVQLLSLGGFQLHKWSSNCDEVLTNVPKENQYFGDIELQKDDLSVKALGVNFELRSDTFKLHTSEPCSVTRNTKREILSYVSKFFDPLGLMGPIFVQAKLIMQSLWAENIGWDEVPPENILQQWKEFVSSLNSMQPIRVPRCVRLPNGSINQLIGFADASLIAHGCCLYLRVIDDEGRVRMNLLCSKSRINPYKKQLTIPRLELNAALLLARLADKVLNTLNRKMTIERTHLFSDSQIALAWINTDVSKLNTYVANRARVIQELSSQNCSQWGYIDTNDNAADCISRGLLPHELQNHTLWWNGPVFLHNKDFEFTVPPGNESLTIPELKTAVKNDLSVPVVCAVTSNDDNYCILKSIKQKFSDINKMQRVLAYVLRFVQNVRSKTKNKLCYLTSKELNDSLMFIIKHEQQKYFKDDINALKSKNVIVKGNLKPLNPFIDGSGLVRVGGRLHNASISFSQKHPVILPRDSKVTNLIIENEHTKNLHAGPRLVLSSINQRFWIVHGLRQVKKVLHKCIICFRLKADSAKQLMGALPQDRVNICRPFQKIGMDFAGPISVKISRIRKPIITKGYVCVFVCFVTKAIHLELASDLKTETFLACLKRFISRRGLPTDIYSDNASTFKCARTQLDELYKLQNSENHQKQVYDFAAQKSINFHFLPCYSPTFAGLAEAGVKSMKFHLKRVMQTTSLTYEELNTLLCQIEAVLNSRPLMPLSADINDFSCITPGHFLIGSPLNAYPEPENSCISRLQSWKVCNNLRYSFWRQWSKNYLNILQSRPKWTDVLPNLKVGSLVILKDDNLAPLYWPMARVIQIFPGSDNRVRVVEVKTANGRTHKRSITKVCLLPIECNDSV